MQKVSIISNTDKDKELELTKYLVSSLKKLNFTYRLPHNIANAINDNNGCDDISLYSSSEVIIVLGGDGTILKVARNSAQYQVPLLGINLGSMGFLSSIEKEDIDNSLRLLLDDKYEVEERMMVECQVEQQNGNVKHKAYALNDIGINRSQFARIVKFRLEVNNEFLDVFRADGVVVATPTGSTAYNLSAGGPIVAPSVNVMLITPICPHSLHSRSFVVNGDDTISIELADNCSTQPIMLSVDGQYSFDLDINDRIYVKRSDFKAKILKVNDKSFYKILRDKLYIGGREE